MDYQHLNYITKLKKEKEKEKEKYIMLNIQT
jgi:hypothetical protein